MNVFCDSRKEEGNTHIYLTDYLSEVALLTDQDSKEDENQPKITLMTIHSAKGLEFKNVFVVGMEEGLFPSLMSDSPRALEEERRLFYVALTRAEEHCFLSYAKSRFKFGKMEFGRPSCFLKDIDSRYLSLPQGEVLTRQIEEGVNRFRRDSSGGYGTAVSSSSAHGRTYERTYERPVREEGPSMFDGGEIPQEPHRFVKPAPQRTLRKVSSAVSASSATGGSAPVSAGQLIEHERFGRGEIIRVEGTGDNCKATVRFQHAGEKQLLLKFARFKVVE